MSPEIMAYFDERMQRISDRIDRMEAKLDQLLSVPSVAAEFNANRIEASHVRSEAPPTGLVLPAVEPGTKNDRG